MISSQIIQKTLDELRTITRIDLCVMDIDGKINSTTFPVEDEDFGDVRAFADSMARCPNWDFVGFYIDEGSTAPRMENAKAWARLLQDCQDGKVDLIVTQKTGNVSQKPLEVSFCARLLAALPHPVGIYFISEDIFTLASYYQEDLRDPLFLPDPENPAREEHHDA